MKLSQYNRSLMYVFKFLISIFYLLLLMHIYMCGHSMHVKVRGELGAGSFISLGMKLRFSGLQSKHFFPLSHFTSLQICFYFYMKNSSSIFSTERKRIDYICMTIWKYFHKFASQSALK